jgi:NAD(P)H-dependent flavin oxidoreductase YrpB (nitropropane dioxygenase family)
VAAVLAAGAAAARIGTRFVAAAESGAHPQYVRALIEAKAEDSVLTDVFAVGWEAPHRVLRSAVEAARAFQGDVVGEHEWAGARMQIPRFGPDSPDRGTTGEIAAMALYAGQSVGAVRAVEPAREIVAELIGGAEELLRRLAPTIGDR